MTLLVSAVAALVALGGSTDPPAVLRVLATNEIPADQPYDLWVTLVLENRSAAPLYVSPVMGEIAGTVQVVARRRASERKATTLYSRARPYRRGFSLDDLFKLMPGRALEYTVAVRYLPLFEGEGELEILARYDPSEMAKGNRAAFATAVESEPVVVRVRKQQTEKH